jgi:secreted trypsin-like serine protease
MHLRSFALFGALSILCWMAVPVPSSAQEACKDPRRIVGGEDTDIKLHPWQVALKIDGELCGGVIIAQNWVLTAAHCFDSTDPKVVRAKAGATDHKIGGVWVTVEKVVLHNFDRKTLENDLALVRLRSRLPGQSIPLARPDLELQQCQHLEVTGWGRTKDGKGGASAKLQKAMVPYVDNATCNEPRSYSGRIRPSMMCAGFSEIDACTGDSGGPLVFKGPDGPVLVGIVSWGSSEGCGKQFKYGVYTRVSAHRDWITKVVTSDR